MERCVLILYLEHLKTVNARSFASVLTSKTINIMFTSPRVTPALKVLSASPPESKTIFRVY